MNRAQMYSVSSSGRDWGRVLAVFLCCVFGLLGSLPLVLGFLLKSAAARDWVNVETRRVIREQLGLEADYVVDLQLFPLHVELRGLRILANDGGEPAISAERIGVTPRIFSLIAGRLDVGDVEIEGARSRLIIEDGKLQNLSVKLPESSGTARQERAPFSSLSVTDATFDLRLDGVAVESGSVDLDVFPEPGPSYEVALRIAESWVRAPEDAYPEPKNAPRAVWDGDVLCQFDLRARWEAGGSALIRRLSVLGTADVDPGKDTPPNCRRDTEEEPAGRIAVRANQLRISPGSEQNPWLLHGDLMTRVPVELANRWLPDQGPYGGWVGLNGTVHYDGSTTLPSFSGRVRTSELILGRHHLMQGAEGTLDIKDDKIVVPEIRIQYGKGSVVARDTTIAPFEPGLPFVSKFSEVRDVEFPSMMSNLGVTNDTIVYFNIARAVVTDFSGSLDPPQLDGDMNAEVEQFEIFNTSYRSPARRHMLGLNSKGFTRGILSIRPDSVQFNNQTVRFGKSVLHTNVHVGFENHMFLETWDSSIELADISPIVTVPMRGRMQLESKWDGPANQPDLRSEVSISDLHMGGFPIGDIEQSSLAFRMLYLQLDDTVVQKGKSRFRMPRSRIDFDAGASLVVDAEVRGQGVRLSDFFEMWKFDEDPRWREITGVVSPNAQVHYVLGGANDPCGAGALRVEGSLGVSSLHLFGESFDGGNAQGALAWQDMEAGYLGLDLDVPTLQLRKGSGSLLGQMSVSPGGKLTGNLIAAAVPLSKLEGLAFLENRAAGSASGVAQLSGTLDQMRADAQLEISPVIVGRSRLGSSHLHVQLLPTPSQQRYVEGKKTGCGRPVPEPSTEQERGEDPVTGVFQINGHLFGEQLELKDFHVTRQSHKVARGELRFKYLEVGPFLELSPEISLAKHRPSGRLSGNVEIERWPLDAPQRARARASVQELNVKWKDFRLRVDPTDSLTLANGSLNTSGIALHVASGEGETSAFEVEGKVDGVGSQPSLDLTLRLRPVELSRIARWVAPKNPIQGLVSGQVRMRGPPRQLKYEGGFQLRDGSLAVRGSSFELSHINVDVNLDNQGITVSSASAEVGGGTVTARGAAPLSGFRIGQFRGEIEARDVSVPLTPGVELTLDADLEATWDAPAPEEEEPVLPRITGEVRVRSFEYTRAVSMNADISNLGGPKRTRFESYDPDKDRVQLDVLVVGAGPLKLNNNLIDASLQLDSPGLRLTGTNQRFGLRGNVRVVPGGRIRLRRNEFEIQSGEVHFDDSTRVAPRVDVTAVTEYRRFSSTTSTGATAGSAATGSSAANSTAGQWRITMHAYGDAENLKLDLTSQPKLSQDDIFLLLTVGLTRAELDQAQSASIGESVALEALGSLTGADAAVSDAIPAIDEFRFGSAYSARTGRTEPTVTIGKRLSQRIRAYVTSGISESREVRSNLEWRLNSRMSVEGSYDNVNDISSSNLGNLGADVRWRLEFE